jgi:hypothetical protein
VGAVLPAVNSVAMDLLARFATIARQMPTIAS